MYEVLSVCLLRTQLLVLGNFPKLSMKMPKLGVEVQPLKSNSIKSWKIFSDPPHYEVKYVCA